MAMLVNRAGGILCDRAGNVLVDRNGMPPETDIGSGGGAAGAGVCAAMMAMPIGMLLISLAWWLL